MTKGRVEAFSDGVIAVIITIMVLELHPPEGTSFTDLKPVLPKVLAYVLSFVFVGIYWNSHHHLMAVVKNVRGWVLWTNMHLLFWLSVIPFTTAWMSEHGAAPIPVALYGANLLMCGIAFSFLVSSLLKANIGDSEVAEAISPDWKSWSSLACYVVAIPLAYFNHEQISIALYIAVALTWFIPDARIERVMATMHNDQHTEG